MGRGLVDRNQANEQEWCYCLTNDLLKIFPFHFIVRNPCVHNLLKMSMDIPNIFALRRLHIPIYFKFEFLTNYDSQRNLANQSGALHNSRADRKLNFWEKIVVTFNLAKTRLICENTKT